MPCDLAKQCRQRDAYFRNSQRIIFASSVQMSNGRKTSQRLVSNWVCDPEFYDLIRAQRFNQLERRTECDDFPVVHDRHAIAKTRRLFHVVSRQEDSAASRTEFINHVPQRQAGLRIQTSGRLIQKQKFRIAD